MKPQLQNNFNNYLRYIKLILIAGDLILLNVSYLLTFYLRYEHLNVFFTKDAQIFLFFTNMTWLFLVYHFNEFTFNRTESIEKHLTKTVRLILYLFLSLVTFSQLFYFDTLNRKGFVTLFLNFIILTMIYRIITIQFLRKIRKTGINFRNVVIVGSGEMGHEIYNALTSDLSQGYQILGYFDNEKSSNKNEPAYYLGKIDHLFDFATGQKVHEVYVALRDFSSVEIKKLISFCDKNLIRIKFVPDYKLFQETNSVSIDFYGNVPVVSLRDEPLEVPMNRLKKRFFDIFFSLLVIVFIFPWLFPILIVLVKLSSRGPVFFKQKRTGEGNREFYCWKFRTMKINKDSDSVQASQGDSRITRVGRILRKTNLDEMPQFFNVLIGNMSVVGPRPHMVKHTNEYSELIDNYLVRHFARPGITGWAQTNGLRGETKTIDKMAKRIEYDIWYIENWSFLLELKIIYFTIRNMFIGDKNAV